jgi:hypothetical protein
MPKATTPTMTDAHKLAILQDRWRYLRTFLIELDIDPPYIHLPAAQIERIRSAGQTMLDAITALHDDIKHGNDGTAA